MNYFRYLLLAVITFVSLGTHTLYATETATSGVISDDKVNPEMLNTLGAVNILDLSGHSIDGTPVNRFLITSLPRTKEGFLYMADGVTTVALRQRLTQDEADGLKFDPDSNFVGDVIFTYRAIDDNDVKGNSAIVTIPLIAPHTTNIITHDDVGLAHGTADPITIDVLDNDEGNLEGATVQLIQDDGSLTHHLIIAEEGVWDVDNENSVTFTPVTPFVGTPSSVTYLVQDNNGATSNSATVRIEGECVCKDYEEDVPSLDKLSLLLLMFLTLGLAEIFIRQEV